MTDPRLADAELVSEPRNVRLLHPHDDLGEDTYHEWWGPTAFRYRDKIGRGNRGSYRWSVWVCNNPGCTAEAILSPSALLDLVAPLLGGVR